MKVNRVQKTTTV